MFARILPIICIHVCVMSPLYAQENVTLSTYYPSPMGQYEIMEITRGLTVVGPANDMISIASDPGGNLTLNGTRQYFQLAFQSSAGPNRHYSFLQPYAGAACTCPDGYAINAYLDSNKVPADPDALPASGYCVCTRGTE